MPVAYQIVAAYWTLIETNALTDSTQISVLP